MGFQYTNVERITTISPNDFYEQYVKPQKPVVIEQLTRDWPAYEKWDLNYIKQIAGEQIVPLYNNDPVDYNKKVNEPDERMKMADYIDALVADQTKLRIFLYSLIVRISRVVYSLIDKSSIEVSHKELSYSTTYGV